MSDYLVISSLVLFSLAIVVIVILVSVMIIKEELLNVYEKIVMCGILALQGMIPITFLIFVINFLVMVL